MAGHVRPLHELHVSRVTRPLAIVAAVKEHKMHIGLRGFVRAATQRLQRSCDRIVIVERSGFVVDAA